MPQTQNYTQKSEEPLFFDSVVVTVAGAVGLLISGIVLVGKGAVWFVTFPFNALGVIK